MLLHILSWVFLLIAIYGSLYNDWWLVSIGVICGFVSFTGDCIIDEIKKEKKNG